MVPLPLVRDSGGDSSKRRIGQNMRYCTSVVRCIRGAERGASNGAIIALETRQGHARRRPRTSWDAIHLLNLSASALSRRDPAAQAITSEAVILPGVRHVERREGGVH